MVDIELKSKICVVGLGYVGLPLAIEFAKSGFETVGYDKDINRIYDLKNGIDKTGEVDKAKLIAISNLTFTNSINDTENQNFYIVCVPTPVDEYNVPDLNILKSATKSVGSVLSQDDIVVFESTVFPGVTEEICVLILQRVSGLEYNDEFHVGYSPERINPGDLDRGVGDIIKVVSCSSKDKEELIVSVYKKIIAAGVHLAESIKVAEAAKVIENTQRDVNIGLINELAIIFDKMNIDTNQVLNAAATKWNFLNFHPGLVGGHCIGVDPYYLTYKAQELGYHPEIISAGRRVNDNMPRFIANKFLKTIFKLGKIQALSGNILILGATFKENCPDIRNSKVFDIIRILKEFEMNICLVDPIADLSIIKKHYGLDAFSSMPQQKFDAVLLAVPHEKFKNLTYESLKSYTINNSGPIFDIRSVLDKSDLSL